MRTLKKSLCLVLALVFVLGLCTVGSNAAFADIYSDAADVTADYLDAIEVLTGLRIINGYKDGTFGPDSEVTRAEAAAMIARMMLGREAADKLPVGEVKFSDVADTHWAVQYIAFCANKGIIVGMGNGTFCPNDPVTGTQLAAMLLRALGYDAMGEYQGKGWDINAVADALYYGVFNDSLVVDFSKPATREETALYIWNTLWINLVGYDVDLNYYKEKTRTIDGKTVELTFANDAYNLMELGYDSRTNRGTYIVLANKYTGSKYTVVGRLRDFGWYDADNNWHFDHSAFAPEYYLDYETPLEFIGHEVTVYIDSEKLDDTEEHLKYNKCYLLRDESTVLDKGKKLDDFYRAAKDANNNNTSVRFRDVEVINNYDYENMTYATEAAKDGDTREVYRLVSDLKGQKSSMDSAPSGTWILDHEGKILLQRKETSYLGKVLEVDTAHSEVEINVYLGWNDDQTAKVYESDVFDFAWSDIDLVYDGIAANDYVVVKPVGELTYVESTTTQTVDITTKQLFIFWYYFNNFTIGPDLNVAAYDIDVKGSDPIDGINPGDKVMFYMTSAGYFAAEVIERAKTEGIVYINHIGDYIRYGEWDQIITPDGENADVTNPKTVKKVQGINQDGEEVVFTFSQSAWDAMVLKGIAPQLGKIYEVRKNSNGYTFDPNVRGLVELENESGKTSFLKNTWTDEEDGRTRSDIYYVSKDTVVIYFTGKGSQLNIEVSNKLSKAEKLFAIAKDMGGSKQLTTVWVPDVEAPEAADSGNYLYIGGTNTASGAASYEWYNDENTPFYTAYVDGVPQKMYLAGPAEAYPYGGDYLASAFYQYSDNDGDGIYELKFATKARMRVVLGDEGVGTIENGYLYLEDAYGNLSDGVELKVNVVDISGGTTTGTKTNTNITSVERLEYFLSLGYQVRVDYMYAEADDVEVPVGTMYVTKVTPPAE
jgi:hypothetical protein